MEGFIFSKLVDPFLSILANYALSDEHTSIVKSLDNHLRLLRARSSDFMEQIERAEQSGTKKRKREVVCWLEQVQSIGKEIDALINDIQTKGFVMKFFSEGRAAELDARVSELLEQSPISDNLVLVDHEVQGHLLPTKELVGDGFKEDFEKIWRMLVIEKVKCIGIHGMGGVGKTTLAKCINNRLVEEKQHRVVWITISEQFSVPKLQDEMARDLRIDDMSDLCDEDKRSSRLNTVLSKLKNVVLIFDDVWKEIDLMKLGDPFSIEGCRLVITTRSKQVCCQIGCSKTIDVKRLQENEAWELFKQIHGPDLNLTSEVEIIVKSTVKKCRGLPLGIITLGGSMKGETASHAWSNVLAELEESVMGQHEMGTYVFKVLKLSFDRLGLREKKRNGYSKSQLCFLHCSTYPEDHEINEEELIQRFIVEGYLERKGSRKALVNEGRSILDSLVSACLLERGKFLFQYHAVVFTMHDLLRGMALEVSEGKTKVFDGLKSSLEDISKEEIWTADIEKVFLWNVASGIISEMEPPNCPNLSTLSLNHDSRNPWRHKSPWSLSHSFFSQMQRLSTLDVSGSGIEGLPESLSGVVSLKALLCAGCQNLVYVPNLGKLKKLEELDLSETFIEEVPGGIEELINLKFLSLVRTRCMKPSGLVLNCTNIQYLLLPTHIKLLKVEEVVGLKHVEKFEGRLEDMGELIELIRNRPELVYRIHVLHQPLPYALDSHDLKGNHLILSAYDFKKAGKDEEVVVISYLQVSNCEWQRKSISEDISRLCDPASLVGLEVVDDEGAEWVIWRREEYVDTSISSSPHPPVFSSLKWLNIVRCKKVKKLGVLPSQFPVLERLEISECSEIEEIIMEVGEETRDNGINNVFLPNLKRLYLMELPRLKSICNATMVCPSIQLIRLRSCTELKKLALIFGEEDDSPPPRSLQIYVEKGSSEEWWEALELGHPTHRHLLKPIFR